MTNKCSKIILSLIPFIREINKNNRKFDVLFNYFNFLIIFIYIIIIENCDALNIN